MQNPSLPLENLEKRHPGVTKAIADSYLEAARVCLDRHHTSPIHLRVEGSGRAIQAITEWQATDQRTRSAWANETDTTEQGAYGCLLPAIELAEGLVAIRRAETLTGADYYVAPPGSPLDDLETSMRLEVSGVDRGAISDVEERLQRKTAQASRGASNLPAIAGVIGFRARLIRLEHLVRE